MTLTRGLCAQAIVLLVIAGCGGGGESQPAGSSASVATTAPGPELETFDYDSAAPLSLQVRKERKEGAVTVQDVTYEDGDGQKVSAYLVVPGGKGPFAGVLFGHWLAEERSDRTEFLDEAVALAARGVVSLLPQAVFPWKAAPTGLEHDRQAVIAQTVAFRRGLDVLSARDDVDPARLGFVGHDYGAMYGALLAGADRRPKAYVLMAPDATWSNWFLKFWLKSEAVDPYKKGFESLDPVNYVQEASPAAVFLQFGESDKYVPGYIADEIEAAVAEPKKVEGYGGGHELDSSAQAARGAWLAEQLGL
ncbi:MAG: hypothetical protein ABI649_01825 [Gaiellaceae bacterium]